MIIIIHTGNYYFNFIMNFNPEVFLSVKFMKLLQTKKKYLNQ